MKIDEKRLEGLKLRFNLLYKDAVMHIKRGANGGIPNELNMAALSLATAEGMMLTLEAFAGRRGPEHDAAIKMAVYLNRAGEMMDAAKAKMMANNNTGATK